MRTCIKEIYAQGIALNKTKTEYHHYLQIQIADLASKYDLSPYKEFLITKYNGNKNGRIDVVWQAGSETVVAFEFDTCRRVKSLHKLLASNSKLLFWVYLGSSRIDSFINSYDPARKIIVIQLPTEFAKVGIKPNTAKPKKFNHNATLVGKSYTFGEVRKKYLNAYEKWTFVQDEYLSISIQLGLPPDVIADNLERTEGAILSRIRKKFSKLKT